MSMGLGCEDVFVEKLRACITHFHCIIAVLAEKMENAIANWWEEGAEPFRPFTLEDSLSSLVTSDGR